MIHFDWTISLGNLVSTVAVLGVALKFNSKWTLLSDRVDTMWRDYQVRHGMNGKAKAAHNS